MKIFAILNITEDSFSDGGKYLAPEAALARARQLAKDADVLDIGGASSHPDARPVPADIEIARLNSVLPALKKEGVKISVDSFSPEVQLWALEQGIDYLNDVGGFPDPALYPALAASRAGLVVMHSLAGRGPATRAEIPHNEIFDRICHFFERRIAALASAGIARERLILDPGMGFFLGADAENSLTILRRLPELKARFALPVLVSVSRKSFLRKITGRTAAESGPASLSAELFAAAQGADHIRTHDPAALKDGAQVLARLAGRA
ncbi:MAG TPA: dihydropteroate synthase [Rhizomicrobium sp.]|nr:dihydropteroate synthase [Rhizomicrobium sp.]